MTHTSMSKTGICGTPNILFFVNRSHLRVIADINPSR